jgi:glycosyltransferase involved in cell wall biosynthesis
MDLPELETHTNQRNSVATPSPIGRDSIRTLIVSSTFPPTGWGGAEIAAEGVASWMAKRGNEVAVYTDSEVQPSAPSERSSTIKRYVPKRSWWRHGAHEHSKQGAARKAMFHILDHVPQRGSSEFAKVVEDFRPDVVMVHLSPGLGLGLFDYCARVDLPVVYVMHDFWLSCARSSMFSRAGSTCEKRELICQWSSAIRLKSLSSVPRLGVWAPSKMVMNMTRAQVGDVFHNVLIERNIVDFADFRRSSPAPSGPRTRFLYVGKVTVAKGVAFVLECLSSLPRSLDFEVEIVGSGDAEQTLKQMYLGESRFHFHGLCNRREVIEHYHRATVLLVPSVWFEPAGLVIYQAQVAGLPVISSDSGGIPELLSGRADSLVIPAGDRAKWVSNLRMIVEDTGLRERMRAAATMCASDYQEAIDAGAGRVVEFCRKIIQSKPTTRTA